MKKINCKKITFNTHTFHVSLGSKELNMIQDIPKDGKYEPWLVKYLEIASNFYGSDKDVVDVGANIGMLSLFLATLQKQGRVYAFEPLSVLFTHLNQNLKNNGINNVSTEKAIVSNTNNQIQEIHTTLGGAVGGSFVGVKQETRTSNYTEKIKTVTLDNYFQNNNHNTNIKIIKIDVECWEKYVLQGATEVIKNHQPIVFIEFNVQNRSIELEQRGKEQFDEMLKLFKHIFLIDRPTLKLQKIDSYSNLRGAMLTGHFVEDLICFNDNDFLKHLQPHIQPVTFNSYHASKLINLKNKHNQLMILSNYPDHWTHQHDCFIYGALNELTTIKLTIVNKGIHKENQLTIAYNNTTEIVKFSNSAIERTYTLLPNSSIHIFTEKTTKASDLGYGSDARELGIQVFTKEIPQNTPTASKTNFSTTPSVNKSLNTTTVKVLWDKAYYGEYDTLFDIFYSFCKIGDRFISLHGEMNIETFHKRRVTNANIAKLYKCEYNITHKGLVLKEKTYIGLGADPRMVSNNKDAYAYIVGYGEAKHPAFLYKESNNSLTPLKGPENFDWGKNWQPFLKDDQLFIVHELTPFSIYKIDLNTYELTRSTYIDSNLSLPAHYTHHTMFRGGANAFTENGKLHGLGRASAQPYKHLPFYWTSENNEAPSISFTNDFNNIANKGFNIIDPTCYFKTDDNTFIGLACSETVWFHTQNFLNLLLVVDTNNQYEQLPTLDQYLNQYKDTFTDKKPNLSNHIFHCDRLQHNLPYTYEYGVKSTGKKGTLVYGPYITIEREQILEIEFAYLTTENSGKIAGIFDVCLSKTNINGKTDYVIVNKKNLPSTDKEINCVTLLLDTSNYINYQLEFRVHVKNGYRLNAFHIKTKEISKSHILQGVSKKAKMINHIKKQKQLIQKIIDKLS